MQLILVLETRKSCNSDYRYIKATIDYFYKPRSFSIRPIYAKNKSELLNQERKIIDEKHKYGGQSVVVICADFDRQDDPLNNELFEYCKENDYELVWMNLNIEHVYLNDRNVTNKEKASINFLKNSDLILSKLVNLNNSDCLNYLCSSNILCILDKYLERK